MLDLFVQDGQRQIVSAVVLARSVIANGRVARDGAAFRTHEHLQHGIGVFGIFGQIGGRAGRDVMKGIHAVGQLAAQLVDARNEGLEVVAVLNPRVFRDLF